MSDDTKRELLITRIKDGFIAERIDGWSEQKIHQHMGRMLLNTDFDTNLYLFAIPDGDRKRLPIVELTPACQEGRDANKPISAALATRSPVWFPLPYQ